MLTFIIGPKGSGKTKRFIDMVNDRVKDVKGNIVCVEKGSVSTFSVSHKARLIDIDNYNIKNYNDLYSFINGLSAGDYDITDIYIDSTLRIGGRNYIDLALFMDKIKKFGEIHKINFIFTLSDNAETLGENVFSLADKIL